MKTGGPILLCGFCGHPKEDHVKEKGRHHLIPETPVNYCRACDLSEDLILRVHSLHIFTDIPNLYVY